MLCWLFLFCLDPAGLAIARSKPSRFLPANPESRISNFVLQSPSLPPILPHLPHRSLACRCRCLGSFVCLRRLALSPSLSRLSGLVSRFVREADSTLRPCLGLPFVLLPFLRCEVN
jgi:hypothetical protein